MSSNKRPDELNDKDRKVETIIVEPNYDGMFNSFLPDITGLTAALIKHVEFTAGRGSDPQDFKFMDQQRRSEALKLINGVFSALNMCAGCMHTAEQVERFRTEVEKALTRASTAFQRSLE